MPTYLGIYRVALVRSDFLVFGKRIFDDFPPLNLSHFTLALGSVSIVSGRVKLLRGLLQQFRSGQHDGDRPDGRRDQDDQHRDGEHHDAQLQEQLPAPDILFVKHGSSILRQSS